ncbi:MAG: phage recombination protein Bet [Eubacteriales bacterium]|nr:phage recombination protein Bet [Eubacteriales bacterium]
MANSLAQKGAENKMVDYESNGEMVHLSPSIIRNYLVSGGGNVSDQEIVMFLNLCRFQHLNPFLRDAYLIKYGSQSATMVTGKDVFTKRARRQKDYAGQQAGIVVVKEDGTLEHRIGTLRVEGESLVGGWAKVYVKGYECPVEMTVSLEEYEGKKANGETNSQWVKKPATMIRKVALVQALREAFPDEFRGLYSAEEMSVDEPLYDGMQEPVIVEAEYEPSGDPLDA